MVGDPVYALAPFDRDGVAAEYAAVPAAVLAPKPSTLSHIESAAVPLAALSAWQGLFGHGGLQAGERVLVGGAVGGVGRFATQLARWRGAQVVATVSPSALAAGRRLGAQEVLDGHGGLEGVGPVDLVFDTVGASSSGGAGVAGEGGSAGLGGHVHDLVLGRDWHPRVPLGDGPATGQRAVAAHRPRICASRADQQGRRGVPAPSVLPSSTR
jgi:threonine dehydrogenase-like Zn-dependent dehydrogenase